MDPRETPKENFVAQSIYSHQYDNGLVLVAEPITSLESVAFTFLTPSGCRFESGVVYRSDAVLGEEPLEIDDVEPGSGAGEVVEFGIDRGRDCSESPVGGEAWGGRRIDSDIRHENIFV